MANKIGKCGTASNFIIQTTIKETINKIRNNVSRKGGVIVDEIRNIKYPPKSKTSNRLHF